MQQISLIYIATVTDLLMKSGIKANRIKTKSKTKCR